MNKTRFRLIELGQRTANRKIKYLLIFFFFSCTKTECLNGPLQHFDILLPRPSHIIMVWFENKGYDLIIGNPQAPYINSLIPKASLMANTYAVTHPSYPNYIAFFAGSQLGVTSNTCISGKPFEYPNIYSALDTQKIKFAWYSESMPYQGYSECSAYPYVKKHNPITIFKNVPDSANKTLTQFDWQDTSTENMAKLEAVVCITPNMLNDMHDGSIQAGDTWLKKNMGKLIEYCRRTNSIFMIFYDESETTTDSNRIPVMVIGRDVKANYKSVNKYDHYSWTRTICSMYGALNQWNDILRSTSVVNDIFR